MNQGVERMNEFIRVFRERLMKSYVCADAIQLTGHGAVHDPVDGRIGKIMFKLVTDLVCTEVLITFRIVPKHI